MVNDGLFLTRQFYFCAEAFFRNLPTYINLTNRPSSSSCARGCATEVGGRSTQQRRSSAAVVISGGVPCGIFRTLPTYFNLTHRPSPRSGGSSRQQRWAAAAVGSSGRVQQRQSTAAAECSSGVQRQSAAAECGSGVQQRQCAAAVCSSGSVRHRGNLPLPPIVFVWCV